MNGGTEMDVREKLVEQLRWWSNECDRTNLGCQASELLVAAANYIANCVTVQEWIPVTERLPDDEQEVLVIAHGWDGRLMYVGSHKRVEAQKSWLTGITSKSSEWLLWGWSYLKEPMVTHWMPLPQPPKGE